MKLSRIFVIFLFTIIWINYNLKAQWEETSGPPYVEITSSLASFTSDAGDTILYAGTYRGGIFLSTNNGDSWQSIVGNWDSNNGGFTKKSITALLPVKDEEGNINLYAGTEGDGIFLSVNNDTNWTEVNGGLKKTYVYDIIAVDTFLFTLSSTFPFSGYGSSGSIFRLSDNGMNWVEINTSFTDTAVTAITIYKDKEGIAFLLAGILNGGVYLSTDLGTSWTKYNNELDYINDLAVMDTIVFAVANSTVFRSTNNGASWISANTNLPSSVTLLAVNDTSIFASTENEIYYSLDKGLQWSYGRGVSRSIRCMEVGGRYLFVGIGAPFFVYKTVWRRPLSEMNKPMGIKDYEEQVPFSIKLNQNYPNPFNPSTTISWELTAGSNVQIKIYDILGKEIKALVNQYYPSGYHKVTANFTGLSSGVYFYRLQAGSYSSTKKLTLLR